MKTAAIFTNDMVLQRRKPIKLWGVCEHQNESATPITVTLKGEDGVVTTTTATLDVLDDASKAQNAASKAQNNGAANWTAVLPQMEAGGPYVISIEGSFDTITLSNIMIGEVWILGGQSNMEMPLFCTYNAFDHAAKCDNDNIRFITIPRRPYKDALLHNWHFEACYSDDKPWSICNEKSALSFSAIGFHFAQMLQQHLDIPVGIISCNWGGTKCECWIDIDRIRADKELSYIIEPYDELRASWDNEENERLIAAHDAGNVHAFEVSEPAQDIVRRIGPDAAAYTEQLKEGPDWAKIWKTPLDINAVPGCLYTSMIEPIAPFAAQGFLWYQGESNADKKESPYYARLFNMMTENWRDLWQSPDMPIIAVELAPFYLGDWTYEISDSYAYVREQQLLATRTNHDSHMVPISDLGDMWNIHPCRKMEVAERLVRAAQNVAYNEDIEYMGPTYKSMRIEDNRCYITFEHVGEGLELREITKILATDRQHCSWTIINDVEIAGEDGVFKEANATIIGKNEICVWSSQVYGENLTVRMGWKNHQLHNLFNSFGIPAIPFRTDGLN